MHQCKFQSKVDVLFSLLPSEQWSKWNSAVMQDKSCSHARQKTDSLRKKKKKKRSIDIIFPRHNRLYQALTLSYTLRQIVLWTCGDPYLTSRRRILAPSTSQIWGHTHAVTHKEYVKVTLDCIPHFFLFAVTAPTRTREYDSCDKTQEHKQNRKRAREMENRRPCSRSHSNIRQLCWCYSPRLFHAGTFALSSERSPPVIRQILSRTGWEIWVWRKPWVLIPDLSAWIKKRAELGSALKADYHFQLLRNL